jgi:type IV pilus assembly protein PilY1
VVTNSAGSTQPITVRPLIEVDPATDKRYVLFGTGKLLSDTDIANTSLQGLYSVADGKKGFGEFYTATGTTPNLPLPGTYTHPLRRADLNANTDLTSGIGSSPASPMGWYYDLGTVETESGTSYAQFNNVDAAAALGMVAFGVNASAGSVCSSAGSGRIYSLTIGTGLTNLVDDNGELMASTADLSGVVTELGYRNVGGTIRLAGGLGDGSTAQPPTDQSGGAGMKRLNWREIGNTR